MKHRKTFYIIVLCIGFFFHPLAAEETPYSVEKLAPNLHCLYGPGGNMAVLDTPDGLLVIDTKFDYKAPDTLKQIKALSPRAIQVLILTHYHWDHTKGVKEIGKSAAIYAHENCKASLVKRSKKSDQPFIAEKVQTYKDQQLLELGGEKIRLVHPGPAHTSGDTLVIFEKAKVIHTGDLFFHEIPPYLDVLDGSNSANWIKVIESLAKKYPDYKLIPGHGKVTTMKSFLRFADYLKYLRQEVAKTIKAGKTAKEAMEIISFDAFPDYQDQGTFTTRKNNILWVYQEFTRKK